MQIHPTRAAVDVAIMGMGVVAVGVATQQAAVAAWGGALILGLAIARAVTMLSISRVRAAGFEMLWRHERRVRQAARGETIEIEAEVRNRDTRAARYVELRAVASPALHIEIEPSQGEVPATGRLEVTVRVTAPRVGRHGIHGLSLEVQGNPGLFEVPLTFANPYGIEVLPHSYVYGTRSAQGGRSRMTANAGRPGPFSGDGYELRELREHQPGDPFKRIAWKASARRGQLLVRDYEREERDVVWLVLDASVELWAGKVGESPLDVAIDQVAAVAQRHLARGDRVGLAVAAAHPLAYLPPERGAKHAFTIVAALISSTDTVDMDRSDLDEADVGARVLEHMRPLDPEAVRRVRASDLDRLARRADRVRRRAPFPAAEVHVSSKRERSLRRYLTAFGIGSPARLEPERARTDQTLSELLPRIIRERPRASVVYIWSPAPDPASRPEIQQALSQIPHRRVDVRWVAMDHIPSVPRDDSVIGTAVADAVSERVRVAQERGARELHRLGVRVEELRHRGASTLHVGADDSHGADPANRA